MNQKTKIIIGVALLLLAMQFVSTREDVEPANSNQDFISVLNPPIEVAEIMKSACYDCHSNETTYPWYSNVAPVSWWVNHHVEEGREHLNFSIWSTYPQKKAIHKLEEFYEEVEEGEMPLSSYTWMHAEAKLTDAQKETLLNWVISIPGVAEELEEH